MPKRRLRVFAGPNGSGKSTIFKAVDKKVGCPYFVNADEIQKKLSTTGRIYFDNYTILVTEDHLKDSYKQSGFFDRTLDSEKRDKLLNTLEVKDNCLSILPELSDSYFSAFMADFLRTNMLNLVQQFCIETVMSDSRKLDYIRLAKDLGYRIYLYFVSTKDVLINIDRVAERVLQGGHDVPIEKIKKRYEKSLENLSEVLRLADRAYLFDNSDDQWVLVGEFDGDAGLLKVNAGTIPGWLDTYLLSKMATTKK